MIGINAATQTKPQSKPYNVESARRIRMAITLCGLKLPNFGRKYKLALSNLYALEKGERLLSENLAERIAFAVRQEGYYCSREWLLYGKGIPPCKEEDLRAGEVIKLPTELNELTTLLTPELKIMQEIGLFHKLHPSSVIVGVFDDGMEPYYSQGDYVGGNVKRGPDIESLLGKRCIVELADNNKIIRQLKRGNKKDYYHLACLNPSTQVAEPILFNQSILSAAAIIWHRRLEA
jgi:hypothetical protein